eukprot:COSAG02_NODE_1216_length_13843_cov_500.465949_2_plen_72_part_00
MSRRILPWALLLRFPSKHTNPDQFPVGLSVSAPFNNVCADLERLHSGFSAVPRPIPVILHDSVMIPVMEPG